MRILSCGVRIMVGVLFVGLKNLLCLIFKNGDLILLGGYRRLLFGNGGIYVFLFMMSIRFWECCIVICCCLWSCISGKSICDILIFIVLIGKNGVIMLCVCIVLNLVRFWIWLVIFIVIVLFGCMKGKLIVGGG